MTNAQTRSRKDQRHIAIELPNLEVTARAELLVNEAPETCRIIQAALPLEDTVYHCIRCGRELFALIPPLAEVPPPENRAMVPAPGDIWLIHFPADYQYNPPGFVGDPAGVFDFIIWYGPDSWALDPAGNMLAGTRWAKITDGLEDFARAAEELWLRGTDRMIIRPA